MKIFFCSSPRAKRKYKQDIMKIHKVLKELGCKHTSSFIKDVDVNEFYSADQASVVKDYREMVSGIKQADISIFEVSLNSLAVGYLVSLALEQGKPVVLLYKEETPPFLFESIQDEKLIVVSYRTENLNKVLEDAIEDAKDQMDVRFNFFISPKIGVYLDWISKNKKIPRAVFLRRLIDEHMKKNKEFKG